MPAHGIDLGGEGSGRQDGGAAPGGHREQVGVVGHDEHGPDLGGQVQDQVVLMIWAIVHRAGYLGQQPSPAVLGRLGDDRNVGISLRALPLEQVLQDPSDVAEDVG